MDRLSRSDLKTTPLGGNGRVTRMATLPDGEGIVYGQEDAVCLFDRKRGPKPAVLHKHPGEFMTVLAVAVHPKSGAVVSASRDGLIRFWDPKAGKLIHDFRGGPKECLDLAFTPDGRFLLAGGGCNYQEDGEPGSVAVWDVATKLKHTFRDHGSVVRSLAITADGKQIASAGANGWVQVHETETGRLLCGWRLNGSLVRIALDPKFRWFAVGTLEGKVRTFDFKTGSQHREMHGHENWVMSLEWSPDQPRLASGSLDGDLRIWHVESGEQIRHFRGTNGIVFRPGTSKLISTGNEAVLREWDVHHRQEYAVLSADMRDMESIMLAKDAKRVIAIGHLGRRAQWEIATGREILDSLPEGPNNFVHEATLLPDGDTLAYVVGCDLHFRSLSGRKLPPACDRAKLGIAAAGTSDGRHMIVLRNWRWVDIHDLKADTPPRTVELTAPAWSIACSGDAGHGPLRRRGSRPDWRRWTSQGRVMRPRCGRLAMHGGTWPRSRAGPSNWPSACARPTGHSRAWTVCLRSTGIDWSSVSDHFGFHRT